VALEVGVGVPAPLPVREVRQRRGGRDAAGPAQVEEGVPADLAPPTKGGGERLGDRVQDLQVRDRAACHVRQVAEAVALLRGERVGHPAVAAAEDADEKWAAVVDLLEADVE